ncbi:MAG TPA: HipA family kinase [Candidatus Limnocylindrales bacterium]|nr:HipA family kinase [Candidatus Limnocylindrales bacterium]
MTLPLRTVTATRYVTPLREGGSLPAIIEADDDGMYVLKFRGAGHGAKALIAELIGGEIARAASLPIPEIVFAELDTDLARTEPDPEIQDLIRASGGLNLAIDYLPGAVTFDPVAEKPDADFASSVVWLDAYLTNIDRTARNANMLVWHRRTWLIDHGAALYFHHTWEKYREKSRDPFPRIADHILLPFADRLVEIDAVMAARITPETIHDIVASITDSWLETETRFSGIDQHRSAYREYLLQRLEEPRPFLNEAIRARTQHV